MNSKRLLRTFSNQSKRALKYVYEDQVPDDTSPNSLRDASTQYPMAIYRCPVFKTSKPRLY